MANTIHNPRASCGPFLSRCGMRHPHGSIPFGWWDDTDMPFQFLHPLNIISPSPTMVEIDIELQERFEFTFPDSRKVN